MGDAGNADYPLTLDTVILVQTRTEHFEEGSQPSPPPAPARPGRIIKWFLLTTCILTVFRVLIYCYWKPLHCCSGATVTILQRLSIIFFAYLSHFICKEICVTIVKLFRLRQHLNWIGKVFELFSFVYECLIFEKYRINVGGVKDLVCHVLIA